jgi:dolichol kinase
VRRELSRKLIHLATVAVPIAVWLVPQHVAVTALALLTAFAMLVEWARRRIRWARYQFLRRTRRMLRPHERNNLAGATYMVLAYLLALLLFPRPVAVVAMLYNGLGDAAAALVGKRWGRHRTSWGKSWEGAAAGLLVNLAVGLAVPGIPLAAVGLGALTAAAVEFLPLPLDDNLRVTLGGGGGAWLGVLAAGGLLAG